MRYSLADHNGTLCVVAHSADYDAPQIVANYYATPHHTIDFLRHFFDRRPDSGEWAALLARFTVSQLFPGHFRAAPPQECFPLPVEFSVVGGGRALPVHGVVSPLKPPRHRLRIEYTEGRWHVETARGWKTVEPCV